METGSIKKRKNEIKKLIETLMPDGFNKRTNLLIYYEEEYTSRNYEMHL